MKVVNNVLAILALSTGVVYPAMALSDEQSTSYIISGKSVDSDVLPWQVRLEIVQTQQDTGVESVTMCGGTVISEHWVLTAAHCLDIKKGQKHRRYKGSDAVTAKLVFNGELEHRKSEAVFVHDYWNGNFLDGSDIALVRFSIPFSNNAPIRIANESEYIEVQSEFMQFWQDYEDRDSSLIVSGYGLIDLENQTRPELNDLQYTWLSGVPENDSICRDFAAKGITCVTTSLVDASESVCRGDSGGPLIWQSPLNAADKDFGARLVGISSFSDSLCQNRMVSGFTTISKYLDWINNKISAFEGERCDFNTYNSSVLSSNPFELPGKVSSTSSKPSTEVDENSSSAGYLSMQWNLLLLCMIGRRLGRTKYNA